MKLIITLIFLLQFSALSETKFITNPLNGEVVESYDGYQIVNEAFSSILKGESSMSMAQFTQEYLKLNPNDSINSRFFFESAFENAMTESFNENSKVNLTDLQSSLKLFSESNQSTQVSNYINILDNGISKNELLSLDEKSLKKVLDIFGNHISSNIKEEIYSNRKDLNEETSEKLKESIFEDYSQLLHRGVVSPELLNFIDSNNLDISNQLCSSVQFMYMMMADDDMGGTVEYNEVMNDPEYEDEYTDEDRQYAEEIYQDNISEAARVLSFVNQLGYEIETTQCQNGMTLKNLILDNSDILEPELVLNKLKSKKSEQVVNCVEESILPDLSENLNQCDLSRIIWMMEKEERKTTRPGVIRVYGEGLDNDCELILETQLRNNKKIVYMELSRKTETATLSGEVSEVIEKLSKEI